MEKLIFLRANTTKFGGAEVYLSRLLNALKKRNINYEVVNSIFPKFLPSWLRVILFNLQACLQKKNNFYFSLERISCPDIYRAGDGVHKVFLEIEKKSRLNPLHSIYLYLEKKCFQNAKYIIANSKMIKHEIIDNYNIEPNKLRVVYNGIVVKELTYQASFERLSREFRIDAERPILLYVGSGFKRKGVHEFLSIVALLRKYDIQAVVVGKEKKIGDYKQYARNLKIDDRVIFTGAREDVDDFYNVSDIFLLPTHYEPFSNVILEAMSFENAVFTTKQNGASEILDDEFVMDKSGDFSIVSKISQLLDDQDYLQQVKVANRLKSKQFSIERNLTETLKVIDDALNLKE